MAKNKPKPGDVYLGDGIYGPKPANMFGLMKRDLSASEFNRYVGSITKGREATEKQYMMLNPGKYVNRDSSGEKSVLRDDSGAIIKAMNPAKARAIVTGRRVAKRAEAARTNKATTRKVGRKNQAF